VHDFWLSVILHHGREISVLCVISAFDFESSLMYDIQESCAVAEKPHDSVVNLFTGASHGSP